MLVLFLCLLCASVGFAEPLLTYSTYLRNDFTPQATAVDSSGNVYMAGYTVNASITNASTTQVAAMVVKLNAQANQYLYVRNIGGSVYDWPAAIAVDAAGNAYIAGYTASPDFPITTGGNLAAVPACPNNSVPSACARSFAVKLDPNGNTVFSDLLGGTTTSTASAVAVDAAGHVFVSGASSAGFPTTPGAYSLPNTAGGPYLLELDPSGETIVFSAMGIGGSQIILDPSGNIYIAGTTTALDYPTTSGVYQPTFPAFSLCQGPACFPFQGPNQYVTKIDPSGSKLIFSTALSGTGGTSNGGLAVDAEGNVYVTGFAYASYPFTVTPPSLPSISSLTNTIFPGLPFLSKLDPLGQTLLWSVPVGGAGVQVDGSSVYVGGSAGQVGSYLVPGGIPALANVSAACLPGLMIKGTAYASKVDAASGDLVTSEFIGGSTLGISGVALNHSTLWIAGSTKSIDFPISPNALIAPNPAPDAASQGAYLGAVDFATLPRPPRIPLPARSEPDIDCVLNTADFTLAGPVAPYQELTIMGEGLGPASGVAAADYSTTSLAGVTVTFDSVPAPLLYVSSTQINVAVPAISPAVDSPVIGVSVGRASSAPRAILSTYANPSLFLNLPETLEANPAQDYLTPGYTPTLFPMALNADGSTNSPGNPAPLGSTISVFVNGLSPSPAVASGSVQLSIAPSGWSVVSVTPETPFELRVTLGIPSLTQLTNNSPCSPSTPVCTVGFDLTDTTSYSVPQPVNLPLFGGVVYAAPSP